MERAAIAGLLFAFALQAQNANDLSDYLDALARTAATFATTAPGLMASETLDQRGRRGYVEILRGRKNKIRKLDVTLPADFRTHHVVSNYMLAIVGDDRALHETRAIQTIDGRDATESDDPRHALTIGIESPDDETKRILLENLDREQLEGAATDFSLLMLLFQRRFQKDYAFTFGSPEDLAGDSAVALSYRQTAGSQGLTVFRERTLDRQPASGEIWFRKSDLLPIRITMNSVEALSKKFTVRTAATVDYTSSPFGLVPSRIIEKQFLGVAPSGNAADDLMIENEFHYSDYHKDSVGLP